MPRCKSREISMSNHEGRFEQKSRSKPGIGNDSVALDENDLERVAGGESITLAVSTDRRNTLS